MTIHTQHLLSEKQVVQQFLEDTSEDEVLERNSWLSRLQSLDAQIEAEQKRVVPARSAITYRGPSVFGSHGIASTFGMAATRAYTKIVQVVAAQWYQAQPLAESRPLKADSKFDMLVIAPAFGSFGFELEEPPIEQLTIEERTVLAQSIEKTQQILKGALESDELLAESLDVSDGRTLTAVRTFLKILQDNDATCAIQSGDREFRFDSTEQVTQARVRLEAKNIVREEVILEGVFEGLLPTPRTFEFRRRDTDEVVVGKVYTEVADIADINNHLGEPARVRTLSHRVGSANARYVLIQNPDWIGK